MKDFHKHSGIIVPLDRVNVDTDQIIPKQFLKRIERTGFGEFLFFDWRRTADGQLDEGFVLNRQPYRNGTILLARANFGCGSSREHAPWALADYGFRAILAPSFADIFYNNCFQNGILPVRLSDAEIESIFQMVFSQPGLRAEVDLESTRVSTASKTFSFTIDPFRRECLLKGLDDTGMTLEHEAEIAAYEAAHA